MIGWVAADGGAGEDGWLIVEPPWSLKGRGWARFELEEGSSRAVHLDLVGTDPEGGGGAHPPVPRGGRAPEGGSEGGVGGLGDLNGGGEKLGSEGVGGSGGKEILAVSWIEGGGGGFWPGEGVLLLSLQRGREEGVGAPLAVGYCGSSFGCGAMAAGIFFLEGSYPIGPSLGLVFTAPDGILERSGQAVIRGILRMASKLSLVDECMAKWSRVNFARICVKLDLSQPIRPGVLIKGYEGPFW